jgi:hypothetical protein
MRGYDGVMNLGQYIGELLLKNYELKEGVISVNPNVPIPAPAPRKRTVGLSVSIRKLLERHPEGLMVGQLAAVLNIKSGKISNALCMMKDVEKIGTRGTFTWKIKEIKAPVISVSSRTENERSPDYA